MISIGLLIRNTNNYVIVKCDWWYQITDIVMIQLPIIWKINWGKFLKLYPFYYICFNINPPTDIHPSFSLLQMTIHEFWLSLIHINFFLCIYFFQLMFYTLSIAVTAVFDFALTSLMRIMILLHPASRQSINLAPSSSWFQQIPFWFRGCTFWDLLDKYLMYLPPT